MSTLVTSNISDGTTSVGTGYVVNGSAKAWVSINQTTQAARDSLNISSITDQALGVSYSNMTNAMSSNSYSQTVGGKATTSGRTFITEGNDSFASPSSTAFTLAAYSEGASTWVDLYFIHSAIHGDLA